MGSISLVLYRDRVTSWIQCDLRCGVARKVVLWHISLIHRDGVGGVCERLRRWVTPYVSTVVLIIWAVTFALLWVYLYLLQGHLCDEVLGYDLWPCSWLLDPEYLCDKGLVEDLEVVLFPASMCHATYMAATTILSSAWLVSKMRWPQLRAYARVKSFRNLVTVCGGEFGRHNLWPHTCAVANKG